MDIDDIKIIFNGENKRFTTSREMMCKIFLEKPGIHFSIKELTKELESLGERNTTTVYNNVSTLLELGIIQRVNQAGKKKYEFKENLHGHCICKKCGKLLDVKVPGLGCLGIDLERKHQAKLVTTEIEIKVLCSNCRVGIND